MAPLHWIGVCTIMGFLKFRGADGLMLNCIDYGGEGGAPVLLMHGAAAHSRWWDFTAPALAGRYHMLAPDRRGHGEGKGAEPGPYEVEGYTAAPHAAIGHSGVGKPFPRAPSGA